LFFILLLLNLQPPDVDDIPNLDNNDDKGSVDIRSSSPEPKVVEIKKEQPAEKRSATKRPSWESEEEETPAKKRPRTPQQPPPATIPASTPVAASSPVAAAPPKENSG
jgi:hypothetical protein